MDNLIATYINHLKLLQQDIFIAMEDPALEEKIKLLEPVAESILILTAKTLNDINKSPIEFEIISSLELINKLKEFKKLAGEAVDLTKFNEYIAMLLTAISDFSNN